MHTFLRWNLLALSFCGVLMLSGCGQKGDLYLPEGNAQSEMAG